MSEYALFKSWRPFKFPIRFSPHLCISCTLRKVLRICTAWHLTYSWWIGWASPKGERSGLEHSTEECCQSFRKDFCYFMGTLASRFDKYIYSKYRGTNSCASLEVYPYRQRKEAFNKQCESQWWGLEEPVLCASPRLLYIYAVFLRSWFQGHLLYFCPSGPPLCVPV